jgi:ribosomal protein S18 acetylase RimI-like enzyme
MDDTSRIRAFTRWLEEITSTRTEPWRFGEVLFNDDFPGRWDSNFLRVERSVGSATAAELAAEADVAMLAIVHVSSRYELGYASDRLVDMVLRRDADRPPPPVEAREVDRATVRPVKVETNVVSHGGMSREDAEMLADFGRVLVDRVGARYFAAWVDGEVAGCCELYEHDGVAQIENVDTLERFRNRGVARAFLHAAIEAAGVSSDLIFLFADDADWPKHLYGRLGFDRVGYFRQFTKPPAGSTYR